MINIDSKGKRLLYELDINSRQSYSQLGKKIRLSSQAVEQRIDKFIKKGIIKSFLTIVAYQKLSYTFYGVYITFQNTTPTKEKDIISRLINDKNVIVLWRCEGKYDLLIGVLAKNVFELNNLLNNIINRFGEYFRDYDIVTHIGAKHYSREYLLNKKRRILSAKIITGGESEQIELDLIDRKIMNYLIKYPRVSFVDLTNKLRLSLDIIRYRYKKLKERNLLQGFSIVMDQEKLDNFHYRILFKLKNVLSEKLREIYNFTDLCPNVKIATKCFGNYELTIDLEIENNEKLREILSNFRNKFSDIIHHYDILRVYSIEKFITMILE